MKKTLTIPPQAQSRDRYKEFTPENAENAEKRKNRRAITET
jgi:hypothetical protein